MRQRNLYAHLLVWLIEGVWFNEDKIRLAIHDAKFVFLLIVNELMEARIKISALDSKTFHGNTC
jgi:hypothetical protein